MENRVIKGVLAGLALIAGIAVFGLAVMWLWNALIPTIFGLTVINYWQALGLLVLSKVFFGGIGHKFGRHAHGHFHQVHGNPIREKWMNMTSEERKKFMQEMHSRHRSWKCKDGRGFEKEI
ncbi:hypothetical protein FACS1894176_11750 [Bacteroidia bacterium]|nr:hypothetical protein FACS1894176_11750 [Bacteroidia bacterium]